MPVMDPTRKRAIVSCRRSYGTLSPIHAIDSGTIAAPVAPASTRAASSQCSDSAVAQAMLPAAHASVASATTRNLP